MQMFQNKFQTLTRQNLLQVIRSKETQNTGKVLYIVLVLVLLLQNSIRPVEQLQWDLVEVIKI